MVRVESNSGTIQVVHSYSSPIACTPQCVAENYIWKGLAKITMRAR